MTEQGEVIENPEIIEVNIDLKLSPCKNKIKLLSNGLISNGDDHATTALLILNQHIDIGQLFIKIWHNSSLRVCADGAANRLYDFFEDDEEERLKYKPDYIIGDLDSIKDDVFKYYQSLGVVIIKQTTQYSTDFTKCVNLISIHYNSPSFKQFLQDHKLESNHGIELERGIHEFYNSMMNEIKSVTTIPSINLVVINGIGGRFDQTIHSITQLYNLKQKDPYFQMSFITNTDIIILISKNGTILEFDPNFRKQCIGNCGLLPIGEPTIIIETIGLKWDVKNWDTSISTGKVSSNNRFVGGNKCYFHVEDDLVLNIEIFLDKVIEYI
ncbi:thiamine pyrophosphokinase [Monosporozyma unispora]|nr:hypothetical protein C6P44_003794 [Kazachstania unispora]